ncbi:MAG: DUF1631 family protein [Propionivibrio sp.]
MSKAASGTTNNRANNRVISLNSLGRDRSPGQRILADCRDQLVTSLSDWLREVAAPISEELFVLADSTRERLQQTRYLDLRADIEKDWSHLIESFRRELQRQTERCQEQASSAQGATDDALDLPDFDGLQLVADDDLSEHIVIREFSAQLAESCDEELYTLDRRIAVLLGHEQIEDSTNPLAPAVICTALADACATIGPDAQARLILMRRIERHLHLALPGIYQSINANLIERGILPDLRRSFRRDAIKGGKVDPTKVPRRSHQTVADDTADVATGADILSALQRLAQARVSLTSAASAQKLPGGSAQATTSPAVAVDRLLLASLDELQHAAHDDASKVIVNQVRLVRESDNARQISGLEAVTIDIVAMLFDFIFDDSRIPLAIKALISRLQIPVLKVAMFNPGFFADRQHPTRRFLGSISGVAIRWGEAVDASDPFYGKLAKLVARIQAEFENDVQVFGTALAELECFVDADDAEADQAALPAANIVMQRELEAEAWKRAQHAVQVFRASHALPAAVDAFLGEHWVGVLQVAAISENQLSELGAHWQAVSETMNDLAWSVEPKKSPADRLRLIDLLPTLLSRINQGLDRIAVNAEQRQTFFDALVKCHAAALKGEATAAPAPVDKVLAGEEPLAAAPSPLREGDLLVTRSVDQGVEVEEVTLVGACPMWRANEREIYRQVSELKRGDWVEFRELGDVAQFDVEPRRSTRERLTWISPQRGILLFSNHRSAKAISIAPDALARQIRDGMAEIIREEPIFERALNDALETMNAG